MIISDEIYAELQNKELSPAEFAVVRLVAQGKTNKVIAFERNTSVQTVKNQLTVAYYKTGCYRRVELTLWYQAQQAKGQ